jgi:exopolysaccharide biosynthesis predicted pyruvyltransferase EpsI
MTCNYMLPLQCCMPSLGGANSCLQWFKVSHWPHRGQAKSCITARLHAVLLSRRTPSPIACVPNSQLACLHIKRQQIALQIIVQVPE